MMSASLVRPMTHSSASRCFTGAPHRATARSHASGQSPAMCSMSFWLASPRDFAEAGTDAARRALTVPFLNAAYSQQAADARGCAAELTPISEDARVLPDLVRASKKQPTRGV